MTPRRARCLVVGYEPTAEADRALAWAERRAGAHGRVVVVNAERSPTEELLAAAADAQADEIVIGTRRHDRRLGRSVCSELLERSQWPVVVVP